MKRTALKRKTPLRAKTALKSSASFANKGAKVKLRNVPALDEPGAVNDSKEASTRRSKHRRGNGLQGVGRTPAQIAHHERVIGLGCFACNALGLEPQSRLCLHHTAGRNKGKGDTSEWRVICLCVEHHDPSSLCGASTKGLSVHHNRKLFVSEVGSEIWCVHETYKALQSCPPWLGEHLWWAYLELPDRASQETWLLEHGKPKGRNA